MGLPGYDGDCYFLAAFLNFAQRRRCAAAILALLFADILRRLRIGFPSYTFANAVSAAFKPDNCFATRSRSFFNCVIIEDTFPNLSSPSGWISAKGDRVSLPQASKYFS